jgi:replicative DNA helicase
MDTRLTSKTRFNPSSRSKQLTGLLTNELGKVPPQAIDLEEAVLGAMMLEREAVTTVIDILHPEVFYHEKHKMIYEAIGMLFKKSDPIDLITVSQELRKLGNLELVGGNTFLAQLTLKINSAGNIEAHARYLVELFIKRELIRISSEIQRDAFEDTADAFNVLDKSEQSLFALSESNIRKSYEKLSTILKKAVDDIHSKKDQEDGLTGIPSGFYALDKVTAGWQRSDLIVVAGRPGMGKTAFVVSAARNAAVDHKKAVAIFSLEMSSEQLATRMISSEAEITSEVLRSGKLDEYQWKQMMSKISILDEAPIFIDDTAALSIMELRAKARRLREQYKIELIIIDYLQLMVAEVNGGGGNRQEEISLISRSLKNLAKELNIPIIALSQLSREVEKQGSDKRPQLSHLRESGAIEQDADMVMFLYRPEYYNITEDADGNPTAGTGLVIIAKNRHGETRDVKLQFVGQYTKFLDPISEFAAGGFGASGASAGFGGFGNMGVPEEFNSPPSATIQSKANKSFPSADDMGVPF